MTLKDGRLKKLLDRPILCGDEITSYRRIFETRPYKLEIYTAIYSNKRLGYEYVKFDFPKRYYHVYFNERLLMEIPKTIFDYLKDLYKDLEIVEKEY